MLFPSGFFSHHQFLQILSLNIIMGFHLFSVFTFFSVTLLVDSLAAHQSPPEAYWNTVLPKSPMPRAIKNLLPAPEASDASSSQGRVFSVSTRRGAIKPKLPSYRLAFTSTQVQHYEKLGITFFFLEKDMKPGTVLKVDIARDIKGATFLPRDAAESLPFSSSKINDILSRFSFAPNSKEAAVTRETIRVCEETPMVGEKKFCATSLESMVDFATAMFGKNVGAFSTELSKETPLQTYKFTETKRLGGRKDGEIMVCHLETYAYAVFFCHNVHFTRAYSISFEAADGTKGKAVAVCHTDSSQWNPNHISFQVLNVKPGTTVPICHVLPEDNIAWVPSVL